MSSFDHTRAALELDRPATYQIQVQGRLDERWSDWFGEMAVAIEREGDGRPITTLTGVVADQAALLGMLRALYTLSLPLLSVTCLGTGDARTSRTLSAEGEEEGDV